MTPDVTGTREAGATPAGPALDGALLPILRCPACRGTFAPPAADGLTCTSCGRCYPVRNGVPVLLVDEARGGAGAADAPGAAGAAGAAGPAGPVG